MPKFEITTPIKLIKGVLHLAEDEVEHVAELVKRGALKLIDEIEANPAPEPVKSEAEPVKPAPKAAKGKAE